MERGWYLDPAVLEREEARVFARTWQLVGAAAQAGTPGDLESERAVAALVPAHGAVTASTSATV